MTTINYVPTRIQEKIAEAEKSQAVDYHSLSTFLAKFPYLEDDINSLLGDTKDRQKKWSTEITELKIWLGLDNRIDLQFMFTRTLELSKSFRARKPLFEEVPVGKLTKDDITSMIARIRSLWRQLCYVIYPDLEAYFSYESYRKEEKRPDYRGMIHWPKTIINSSSTKGVPLEFVCQIIERRFDTSENLLLMVVVNWLHRDAKIIHEHNGFPTLSTEQKNLIHRVYRITDRILETTSLHKILDKDRLDSKKKFESAALQLMEEVRERINTGMIQNPNYIELLRWTTRYIYFNVDKIHGVVGGIRMDSSEDIHKMYEYWVMYEFAAFLENYKQLTCRITREGDFDIRSNQKNIKLIYNKEIKKKELATKESQWPDYQILTSTSLPNGSYWKPLVLDAKNYLGASEYAVASNKINRYIDEMFDAAETSNGVLFFPVKKWSGNKTFKEERFTGKWTKNILGYVICPDPDSAEANNENFGKIYEEFLKPHLE